MQNIWSVDADDIRTFEDFDEKIIHITPGIEKYLNIKKDTKLFVVATKGVGKTFLLTAKRRLYQEIGVACLPTNSLRDMFIGNTIFNKSTITLLDNFENWSTIWGVSIILAILKKSDISLNEENNDLKQIASNPNFHTVSDFFQNILATISLDRDLFYKISSDYNSYLIPKARQSKTAIAIFLDKLDEYFHSHISLGRIGTSKSLGEIEPQVWFLSQMGLVDAIYNLARLNHHFKIFASIRKEAFEKFREAKLYRQYRAASLELSYSRQDLLEMFEKYIRRENITSLANPSLIDSNPVSAFIGIHEFTHSSVTGKKEDPFAYMYRHTLQRPRDLMVLGEKISSIRIDERTEERLKREIDSESSKTADEYLSLEVQPYFKDINVDEIISYLDSNVLSSEDIRTICAIYNDIGCDNSANCNDCSGLHIFCFLYKIGLLGCVTVEHTTKKVIQKFLSPGEKTFEKDGILPPSNYYLVHPILYSRIQELHGGFTPNKYNIVGYQLEWNDQEEELEKSYSVNKDHDSSKSELVDKLTELVCELETFTPSDPAPETGLYRSDIQMALSKIIGEDNAIVLDLGCGSGPLMQALVNIDSEQLKTLTYIGVNYNDIAKADNFAKDNNLFSKLKKCSLFKFEDIELLNLKADFIFMIDILHHLCPAELDIVIRTALTCLKNYKSIIIIESLKQREFDKFHWTPNDIKNLFKGYSSLKTYSHELRNTTSESRLPMTIASVKKMDETIIGSEFKDRCYSSYANKLEEVREMISKIENSGKPEFNKKEEKTPLYMIERSILLAMEKSRNIWAKQ